MREKKMEGRSESNIAKRKEWRHVKRMKHTSTHTCMCVVRVHVQCVCSYLPVLGSLSQ
jgi:hypothetical protein